MRTPAVGDFILDKGDDLGVVIEVHPPDDEFGASMDVLYIRPYKNFDPLNHPGSGDPFDDHVPWPTVGVDYIKSYVNRVGAFRRPNVMGLECPECGRGYLYFGETEYLCQKCR